jgi:hypothetical protein
LKTVNNKIWNLISVLVIITPKETSSLLPTTILLLPLYIVFQNWKESSWNKKNLARDYASSLDQIYHLTLRNTTVRTETPL